MISGATVTNGLNPRWPLAGAGTLTNANSLTPTYQPAAALGVYTVTLTLTVDRKAPCIGSVTSTQTIRVLASPENPGTITAVPGLAYVCVGSSEQYSITPFADPATVYNWSLPPGATITAGAGTSNITVLYGTGSATGNVTVYGSNSCGNGPESTMTRQVNNVPVIPGSFLGLPAVCQGTLGVVYSIAPVPGATDYTWTVPVGAGIGLGWRYNKYYGRLWINRIEWNGFCLCDECLWEWTNGFQGNYCQCKANNSCYLCIRWANNFL